MPYNDRSRPTPPAIGIDLRDLHPEATFVRILGVNYVHTRTEDDGDLYLTEHGARFHRQLQPENWYEDQWFRQHRVRLEGTGTVYRVPTRPIDAAVPSMKLVVKWSRVGQDIPLDTFTLDRNLNAEFNSPFEEFSLVEELRRGEYGPREVRILTQKPLGIFVPPERMQHWQTGRSRDKIVAKVATHPGVMVDVLRSYILLYGWIDGDDGVAAFSGYGDTADARKRMKAVTHLVNDELAAKGFMVADHKPTHVILRIRNGEVRKRKSGQPAYAIVDYELLARTKAREDTVLAEGRQRYLKGQRDRFESRPSETFPIDVVPWSVLGVPYIAGRAESTGGRLWIVGNNPDLLPYFLPERWRQHRIRLSQTNETYYTHTKDRIHLVWKVSRVGELPPGKMEDPKYRQLLLQGFNSPFEEFSVCLKLREKGVKTVYPRAIYMTGAPDEIPRPVLDDRRFTRMNGVRGPDGESVLPANRDYITLWGYWRGLEDRDAVLSHNRFSPIDALRARAREMIDDDTVARLLDRQRQRLASAGFSDLRLKPDHLLLSYVPEGPLQMDADGLPVARQCNFETVTAI